MGLPVAASTSAVHSHGARTRDARARVWHVRRPGRALVSRHVPTLPAPGTRQGRRSPEGWGRLRELAVCSRIWPCPPGSGAVLRHPCLPGTSRQQGDLQAAPGTRSPRGCCHRNAPSSWLLAPHGTAGAQRVPPQQRYITCKPSPEPGWRGQRSQPWCGRTRHSRGARKEVTAPGIAESPKK